MSKEEFNAQPVLVQESLMRSYYDGLTKSIVPGVTFTSSKSLVVTADRWPMNQLPLMDARKRVVRSFLILLTLKKLVLLVDLGENALNLDKVDYPDRTLFYLNNVAQSTIKSGSKMGDTAVYGSHVILGQILEMTDEAQEGGELGPDELFVSIINYNDNDEYEGIKIVKCVKSTLAEDDPWFFDFGYSDKTNSSKSVARQRLPYNFQGTVPNIISKMIRNKEIFANQESDLYYSINQCVSRNEAINKFKGSVNLSYQIITQAEMNEAAGGLFKPKDCITGTKQEREVANEAISTILTKIAKKSAIDLQSNEMKLGRKRPSAVPKNKQLSPKKIKC